MAATLQRLILDAEKADARAAAARLQVKLAKLALRQARKLAKSARKAAKQARKLADAAESQSVAAETAAKPAKLPKARPRPKSARRTTRPPAAPAAPSPHLRSAADVAKSVIERLQSAPPALPPEPRKDTPPA